jgi:hypothetical protein
VAEINIRVGAAAVGAALCLLIAVLFNRLKSRSCPRNRAGEFFLLYSPQCQTFDRDGIEAAVVEAEAATAVAAAAAAAAVVVAAASRSVALPKKAVAVDVDGGRFLTLLSGEESPRILHEGRGKSPLGFAPTT